MDKQRVPQRGDETKFIKPKDFLIIERSPSWEANSQSTAQNISLNLNKPILHNIVQNSLLLVTLLSQMKPSIQPQAQ